MYEDPDENRNEDDTPARAWDPEQRLREKADEIRMHAELAAVFEGGRKFDAELKPGLDVETARQVQRTMARLEKQQMPDLPVLKEEVVDDARTLLTLNESHHLSTNDYHLYRRPGEVMIVRWLSGEEVEQYYQRLQAHTDAALNGYRTEQRQAHEWKQDETMLKYLDLLDKLQIDMPLRYLREPIRTHGFYVLSTITADEMNIAFLADHLMSVAPESLVGPASAPGDQPSDQELAWFFKLFLLRGTVEQTERMCFFTFLQKADDFF